MGTSDATSIPAPLDAAATRDALEHAAVVRWWQTTTFLEVAGPDAASFLDGLCTQAVERIDQGSAVLGLFLDAKAKIIAPTVLHRTDDAAWTDPRSGDQVDAPRLLLETLPECLEPLRAHLARYRLRAKATIEPVELATVAVTGAAIPDPLPRSEAGSWTRLAGAARPTRTFVGSPEACALLVREQLPELELGLADPDAVEADRIVHATAGIHDLLPGRMPAEVGGMDAAVALDAGCYLGQEPVARLHYRGRANRTLRRLAGAGPLELADAVDGADPLELRREDDPDGRAVGRLTTWATGPDGGIVALAMLRRELAAGELVRLPGTSAPLRVEDAPPE